jgi:hypothetical protein
MFYLSPQIAKLLTEERLREAMESNRQDVRPSTARTSRFAGLFGRPFVRRPDPVTAPCAC